MTNSDIISNYYYNMVQSLNNFPLNKSSNQSTGSTTPCGPCKPEDTYELYYKNLKSYPFTVDMSNDNYLITKFSLPDGKVIVLTTDMRDPNNIISTFSGDVPPNMPLVKTTHITSTDITVTYV